MAISVQPIEFTAQAIKKKADGAKSIALVSADKKIDSIISDVAKTLESNLQTDEGVSIIPLTNALYDYESAKKASECDKVVIVVKYGHTTHKTLQNLKSSLELCGADVIGVIAKK